MIWAHHPEEDDMPASLQDACVLVVGGSSGIGLATAKLAREAGARVVIAGRDKDRLAAAQQEIGKGTEGFAIDVADEGAVRDLMTSIDGDIDHVATFAGTHVNGPITDVDTDALSGPVGNRFWGPVYLCK